MRLQGKVAIVTGGGAGLGKAIAHRLAEEGADVVIGDTDETAAQAVAAHIHALGRRAVAVRADVTRTSEIETVLEEAMQLGPVDILINNAGVEEITPLLEISEEEWDRTLDTNLKGVFLCSQMVARAMIAEGRGGRIVNIGSIAGIMPPRREPHYAASKGAVHVLTRQMALELAPHDITVNAVAPGVIKNGLSTHHSLADPERAERIAQGIPLGRVGAPLDISHAVLFLVSGEADYITGVVLPVDGGFLLGGLQTG
jgi:NAD(P)-dependent dehydrogenase (short-subunit alcohol dehydrogenase family)